MALFSRRSFLPFILVAPSAFASYVSAERDGTRALSPMGIGFDFTRYTYRALLDGKKDLGTFGVRNALVLPIPFLRDYHIADDGGADDLSMRLYRGAGIFQWSHIRRLITADLLFGGVCENFAVREADKEWRPGRLVMKGHGCFSGNRPYLKLEPMVPDKRYRRYNVQGLFDDPRLSVDINGTRHDGTEKRLISLEVVLQLVTDTL